jgi:hypothetical protein
MQENVVGDIEGLYIVVPKYFHHSAASIGTEGDISKDFSAKGPASVLPVSEVSMAKSSYVKEKQSEFLRGSHWRVLEGEAESGLRKGLNDMTFKKENKEVG